MAPRGWSLLVQPLLPSDSSRRVLRGPTMPGSPGPVGGKPLVLVSASAWNCLPQLFNIRPIWSRNAVKANISVHPDKLKVLLPFMAYYMVSVFPIARPGSTRVILVPDVTCPGAL